MMRAQYFHVAALEAAEMFMMSMPMPAPVEVEQRAHFRFPLFYLPILSRGEYFESSMSE